MSEHKGVMAIDPSGHCGVAIGVPGEQPPRINTWKLPSNPEALGETLFDFRVRMDHEIESARAFGKEAIGTIIFEKPILDQRTPNLKTGRKLYSIAGLIEMTAYEEGIACYEIAAGTWRKVFCNRGNISKSEVPYPPMVRCHELGWKVDNHHEADAAGIWYTWGAGLQDHIGLYAGPLFESR